MFDKVLGVPLRNAAKWKALINESVGKKYVKKLQERYQMLLIKGKHCVKSVQIRSFSGPYFPVLELNTEIYTVNLRIQSKCGKIQTRKTPYLHNFYAVKNSIGNWSLFVV